VAFSSDELQTLLADGADLRPATKSKSRDPTSRPGDVMEEVLSKPGRAFRMQNVSIQRAGDLPAVVRAAVEQPLGRAIAADEEVSVSAVPPNKSRRWPIGRLAGRRNGSGYRRSCPSRPAQP
jgi:hypothetical protein